MDWLKHKKISKTERYYHHQISQMSLKNSKDVCNAVIESVVPI